MDIGLGRFLEMFEERYGRLASTCLIGVIALGIVSVLIPLIWQNLARPIYGFCSDLVHGVAEIKLPEFGWESISNIGAGIMTLGAIVFLASLLSGVVNLIYVFAKSRIQKKPFRQAMREFTNPPS